MTTDIEPISKTYASQGLKLHYLDWGNEAAPLLFLVHGMRDHARSWDWVASELRHDWHVVVPDLRGHGDSEWSPDGAYHAPYYLHAWPKPTSICRSIRPVISPPMARASIPTATAGNTIRGSGTWCRRISPLASPNTGVRSAHPRYSCGAPKAGQQIPPGTEVQRIFAITAL